VRPSPEQVAAILPRFVGEIEQIPPNFSAVRVNERARLRPGARGVEMSLEPRRVRIDSAQVVGAPDADHVEIEITCGKGTYVRALARDLAEALGACGHVSALRRTRVGGVRRVRSVTLESSPIYALRPASERLCSPSRPRWTTSRRAP
jgi:tRNA pseudouridine55 synthase